MTWLGPAGAAVVIAFCLLALPDADGREATFAAAFLTLLACSVAGAFLYDGTLRGSLHCAYTGLAAVCACGVVALLRDGPVAGALLVGLFGGLLAFATGTLAHLTRLPVVIAAVPLLLMATFFYWDNAFLFHAEDRKGSAALAFELNPAAAASVTLGFDWIHCKGLYADNQTAESLVGVETDGVGPYSWKLALLAGLAALLGRPR